MMLEFLQAQQYNFVVVMTKSDKLNKSEYAARKANILTELPFVPQERILPFSATNGEGAEQLKEIMAQYIL